MGKLALLDHYVQNLKHFRELERHELSGGVREFGLARARHVPPAHEEKSMSRIISALILAVAAATAFASEPLKLAPDAPESHIVVKGDTLWGISGKFLKEPWRWPEIWRLNKDQIKNPHLIYPGDVVLLDMSDGRPRLRLGKGVKTSGNVKLSPKVHSELLDKEIPSIPAHVIEPFISRPLVVGEKDLENAPSIIGTEESRVIVGNGDDIYVLGVQEDHPKWYVYRPGVPLKDPGTGEILGYEAFYLGTAQVKRPGEVTTMEVQTAKEEIIKGDLLVPAELPDLKSYVPRKAEYELTGQIISVYGGVGAGGKDSVIAINQGIQHGVEVGHVLGLFTKRTTTYRDKDGRNQTKELPEERYGVVFIFRTFDRVSYGLVMEATHPLVAGDAVHNP